MFLLAFPTRGTLLVQWQVLPKSQVPRDWWACRRWGAGGAEGLRSPWELGSPGAGSVQGQPPGGGQSGEHKPSRAHRSQQKASWGQEL